MKLETVSADDKRLTAAQSQYFREISERFGIVFDPHAGEKANAETDRQWHLIAVEGDEVLGCGSLRDLGNEVAEVKRVWVSSQARGRGVASAIMDRLEERAEEEDFSIIRLDTNGTLKEAQAMYAKRGYREIERYNDNPYAEHFYEKQLTFR